MGERRADEAARSMPSIGVAMLETDSRFSSDASATRTRAMYDELLRRIAAIPGVESAALTRGQPMAISGQRLLLDRQTGDRESSVAAVMISAVRGISRRCASRSCTVARSTHATA